MSDSGNEISKIAQTANLLSVRLMREAGLGTAEYELLRLVKQQPGISQKDACARLGMDKGALARRAVNLEQKGYLSRRSNPKDARSQLLFPEEKTAKMNDAGSAEDFFMTGCWRASLMLSTGSSAKCCIHWKRARERKARPASPTSEKKCSSPDSREAYRNGRSGLPSPGGISALRAGYPTTEERGRNRSSPLPMTRRTVQETTSRRLLDLRSRRKAQRSRIRMYGCFEQWALFMRNGRNRLLFMGD
ncbi:MAG: MarR family winged helix-turn-helix transcriptional regulator [Clostridiales bacterium]|nr:MarR family winged helix-turn-helix transcriptional regulator [Clostridiales bacterium]